MLQRLKNCDTIIKTVQESFKPLTKEQAVEALAEIDPNLPFFKVTSIVDETMNVATKIG